MVVESLNISYERMILQLVSKGICELEALIESLKKDMQELKSDADFAAELISEEADEAPGFSEPMATNLADRLLTKARFAAIELYDFSASPIAGELKMIGDPRARSACQGHYTEQDRVVSHYESDGIFVRTPLLWNRQTFKKKKTANGKKTITTETVRFFRDSVIESLLSNPGYASFDFSVYQEKTIQYLFIYSAKTAEKRRLVDADNHETKYVTDAICALLPSGDSALCCSFFYSTVITDDVPEGTYITITPELNRLKPANQIIEFWKCKAAFPP